MESSPLLFDSAAFGENILPGLALVHDMITQAEEQSLIAAIDAAGLTPFQFQQWTGKRLTRSFGWSYNFQNGTFNATEPIPEWLAPVKHRAERFAGLKPDQLIQALIIRYDPGATIGWHRDRPVFEHVVGISLGAPAVMRFRKREKNGFSRRNAPLAARSMYHLSGEARHCWEHSIAELSEPRWSVTFRSLATAA